MKASARPHTVSLWPVRSTMEDASISTTGSRMTAIAEVKDGRFSADFGASASAVFSGAAIGTHLTASLPNSGPEMITVGMATIRPSARVMPRFAFSAPMAVSGPGCGGTNACRVDRPARAGMPSSTTGALARRAAKSTTGMRMTTPTSKNIGMPTMNAISAMAHGRRCNGVLDMMVSTMVSAPPDLNRIVPMIEPNAISRPTLAMVEPTPDVKLSNALSYSTPAHTVIANEPASRERNGCTLHTAIRRTMMAMPMIAAAIRFMNPPRFMGLAC